MAETKAKLNFVQISQSLYDGLATKASNTLYFCPDTQRIHLGDKTMSRPVQVVGEIPAQRVAGNIYYCDGSLYYDNGEEVKSVSGEQDLFDEYSNSTSTSVKKISQEYLPDIQFQGKPLKDSANNVVSGIGRSINFIGIGNVTVDDDGNITVRLGENLNSSVFGSTNDGVTDGSCYMFNAPTVQYTLPGGTEAVVLKKSSTAALFKTRAKVHMENGESYTVVVKNTTEGKTIGTYSIGPVNKLTDGEINSNNNTYTNGPVTLTLSNFTIEENSEKGATGYSANLEFAIRLDNIAELNNGYVTVEIKQGDDTKNAYKGNNLFYYVTTTDVKPVTTATISTTQTKVVTSGISALSSCSVKCSATATNVAYPATYAAQKLQFYFDALNSWSSTADKSDAVSLSSTEQNNLTKDTTWTRESSFAVKDGKHTGSNISISAKAGNVNGYGEVATVTLNKNLLIDSHTKGTTNALSEPFDNETYRVNNSFETWNSANVLGDGELMVYGGKLQYPTGTYVGYNDGLESIVGSNQPDYSSMTGTRYYIRKFTKTGSLGGGSLTIGHDAISGATLKSAIDGGSLKIEVAKNTHDKWYDVTKLVKDGGIGTGFGYGSNGSTSATISFAFTDGTSASDVYVRITLTQGSTVKLTSITADLA